MKYDYQKMILALRDRLIISQVELAKRLEVSVSTIKRALKESKISFVGHAKSGRWKINE